VSELSADLHQTAPDDSGAAGGRGGLPRGVWPDAAADGARLRPHTPRCLGCGPDAPAGYHLQAWRDGDTVVATYTFGPAQEGSPGLAHGGAVSVVCDDLLGHVLSMLGTPAVTRRLEVDFRRPVVLGEEHRLVARLDSHEGRKFWVSGEAHGQDGGLRFSARGLFVQVGVEHFLAGLPPEQQVAARAMLARQGGDVEAW
jgi:acyl-coenzyme A thioesterase PaaI-like protein